MIYFIGSGIFKPTGKQVSNVLAIKVTILGDLCSGQSGKGGHDVQCAGYGLTGGVCRNATGCPKHSGNTLASFPSRNLAAAENAGRAAMITLKRAIDLALIFN